MMKWVKSARGVFIVFALVNFAMLFQTKPYWPIIVLNMFSSPPLTDQVYRLALEKSDGSYQFLGRETQITWYLNIYRSKGHADIYPIEEWYYIARRQCKKRFSTCDGKTILVIKRSFIERPINNEFKISDQIAHTFIL